MRNLASVVLVAAGLVSCSQNRPSDQDAPAVQPSPAIPAAQETAAQDDVIGLNPLNEGDLASIQQWLLENERLYTDLPDFANNRPAFRAVTIDLNDDGNREVLLQFDGFWQGTGGGGLYILGYRGNRLVEIDSFSIGHLPVGVLSNKTNGWHDITIFVSGGGYANPGQVRMSFDGENYPYNPSMPPAEPTDEVGTIALSEETPLFEIPLM